ncbi:MAG TPA: DNA adenine methylase [Acidimicrobiales bacterium]|nr:DNA adenine methylase [Acidimicrobiales bacterium]
MIKYLGSKRRLVPVLERLAVASGARSALDLFTGTTRVAQAFKRRGLAVTAVDIARYSEVFARCYVAVDGDAVDRVELAGALGHLQALPGTPGYITETFCVRSRFFQPFNGARMDAIRQAIATDYAGSPLEPILLTSLIEAADRVDSTIGLQMAYVKEWADRSYKPLELRVPELLPGGGRAVRGDARTLAGSLGSFDLAYLDPPYNQHRYYTNYHVWETMVAWDAPAHYGVACKRVDAREASTKSVFNAKREMPAALRRTVGDVDCELLVLSYNDESWIGLEELQDMCAHRGRVATLEFDSARYMGARTGIHNPAGQKVGTVSHLRNRELLVVAGPSALVQRALDGLADLPPAGPPPIEPLSGRPKPADRAAGRRAVRATDLAVPG